MEYTSNLTKKHQKSTTCNWLDLGRHRELDRLTYAQKYHEMLDTASKRILKFGHNHGLIYFRRLQQSVTFYGSQV